MNCNNYYKILFQINFISNLNFYQITFVKLKLHLGFAEEKIDTIYSCITIITAKMLFHISTEFKTLSQIQTLLSI